MRRAERRGTETLADIARSYNVSQATILRLAP
jgi:DNA-binding MurR/RpiR family transcriptional regulator